MNITWKKGHLGLNAKNLSSGFLTKRGSNQSPQLQRLARIMKLGLKQVYDMIFQKVNNKGADQSVRKRRLVCSFVVRKPLRQVFSHRGPFHNIPMNQIYILTICYVKLK